MNKVMVLVPWKDEDIFEHTTTVINMAAEQAKLLILIDSLSRSPEEEPYKIIDKLPTLDTKTAHENESCPIAPKWYEYLDIVDAPQYFEGTTRPTILQFKFEGGNTAYIKMTEQQANFVDWLQDEGYIPFETEIKRQKRTKNKVINFS